MIQRKTIGVIVPAFNEERLVSKTLGNIPLFVDKIIVVNDASTDKTRERILAEKSKQKRIILIDHEINKGLGASLADGYLRALELNLQIIAVMAGDNQMDPRDLKSLVLPVAKGDADYAKGNRLLVKDVSKIMPKHRFIGNIIATFFTKFATGYWPLIDPQCGYTAISREALEKIDIGSLRPGYGYNADILLRLNIFNFKITDIEVRPIYGEEKSGIKFFRYSLSMSFYLLKLFLRRLKEKYLIRDFHPLVLFYLLGFIDIFLISFPLAIRFFLLYFAYGVAPLTTLTILIFTLTMGFFSVSFAIWLDIENNKHLFVK